MTSTSTLPAEPDALYETDAAQFDALEAAVGEGLKETLQRFVTTCDELCERLETASACAHWQEAARVTLLIGEAAQELGLDSITKAAKAFADGAYHQMTPHRLRNAAQTLVFEYERLRLAMMARYPDFVAPGAYSIA